MNTLALDLSDNRLVVAQDRLALHEVVLPPTPTHRLLAALAGVLEEQLLDDPADLHFAVAPDAVSAMQTGRPFNVIVCDKAWLRASLASAQAQGLVIEAIVPQSLTLQQQGWNLAQFDLRVQSSYLRRAQALYTTLGKAPEWRMARLAVIALVAVNVLGLNFWAWREKNQIAIKQQYIEQVLRQTYPEMTLIVNAPLQMKKALEREQAGRASNNEMSLEAQLAKAVAANRDYQKIDFVGQVLSLSELKAAKP